jgi:hypothetical protein
LGFDPAWDRLITPKNPPCRFACHAAKCAKSFSGNHRMFPVEIRKSELGRDPNARFETFTNDLAVYFYPGIIIAVADILKQVWHFGK